MKEVAVHKTDTEIVTYMVDDLGRCCLTAHTDNDKYSLPMLKAILKTFLQFKEVYTILPHKYLVTFYERHAKLELISGELNLYRIWR